MNALRLLIAAAAALLLPAAPLTAATYVVDSDRDSYLVETSPGTNNGAATEVRVITNGTGGGRSRAVYGFTLPSIPAGEVISSAILRVRVTVQSAQTVTAHYITGSWTEAGVNWTNTAAAFNATAEASFVPNSNNIDIDLTTLVRAWQAGTITNHGVMLLGANNANARFTSKEWGTAGQRPRLTITTVLAPVLTVVKSSSPYSDPFNGTTNPKAIPGATMTYTISASNSANGAADNNSTVLTETVPANMELYVGDIGGAGSGPLAFTNGATSSGLTYTFTSLASAADSISFSNNGGASYAYTPVPDGNGYDANVTHFRVNPSGSFAARTGATDPSFSMQLRMRVK